MAKGGERKLRAALVAGAMLALGAAGCGGSDDASSSSADKGSGAGPDVAYATEQVEKYSQVPAFEPGGEAVDVASVKGKAMTNIPTSSEIPFCVDVDVHMQQVAERAGMKFHEFENKGQPSEWARGVTQAINRGDDLISLQCGILPQTLAPQLRQAREKKIELAASHFADPSYPMPKEIDSAASSQFNLSGRLTVDYAVKAEDGKPVNLLVVTANEVTTSPDMVKAIEDEMQKVCGSTCSTKVVNVPVTEWATKIQSTVQSELTSNPKINWIVPIYDAMALYTAPGVRAAGKRGQVKIATFNGTPPVLKLVKSGDVAMDVAENTDWVAHVAMDQIFRQLTGAEPLEQPSGPIRIIDSTNVDETGADFTGGFGEDYKSGYAELWGLGE